MLPKEAVVDASKPDVKPPGQRRFEAAEGALQAEGEPATINKRGCNPMRPPVPCSAAPAAGGGRAATLPLPLTLTLTLA